MIDVLADESSLSEFLSNKVLLYLICGYILWNLNGDW